MMGHDDIYSTGRLDGCACYTSLHMRAKQIRLDDITTL